MTHSIKLQLEMTNILRDIAFSLEKSNELFEKSLEQQARSLKLAERNSNANMAFHLELTEALKDETD